MNKKINKIISLFLLLVLTITTIDFNIYAEYDTSNEINTDIQISDADAIEMAVNVYQNLSTEAREKFINNLELLAASGNDELLKFHVENVDTNYNYKEIKKVKTLYATNSLTLAQELSLLALPKAVEYSLLALAGALGIPVGNVVDVIISLGVVAIIAANWNTISPVWDDIVDIFSRHIGGFVVEGFDYIYNKATGLPTERQFSRFNYHYDKHSEGFKFMPTGNGKKPDKKKFWEMAKKALEKTGSKIKTGISKQNPSRTVKFNTESLEIIIYDTATKLIRTYYIPYDEGLVSGRYTLSVVKMIAEDYFQSLIR